MSKVKTCEEYVLRQLELTREENKSIDEYNKQVIDENEKLRKELSETKGHIANLVKFLKALIVENKFVDANGNIYSWVTSYATKNGVNMNYIQEITANLLNEIKKEKESKKKEEQENE